MKTAVEFLASVLSQTGPITEDDFNSLVEQAKEMEKKQSIQLIREAAVYMAAADFDEDIAKMTFEDIYEIIKQQEQ
jgi:hypothetical protein